jgi:hypothetical protein
VTPGEIAILSSAAFEAGILGENKPFKPEIPPAENTITLDQVDNSSGSSESSCQEEITPNHHQS